ncbi:MAG: DUF432 domain-containing protein [Lachnospiraceae bacterium]|nr:DUF432 domain-containing protein [Lachnospiraceae bacterium]
MLNLQDFFNDQYKFALKKVIFNMHDNPIQEAKELNVEDSLTHGIKDDMLLIEFKRKVHFDPESVFDIEVAFLIQINIFKEKVKEAENIDWTSELLEQKENAYFLNVIPRAAGVISDITSSYGQPPIITPPVFVDSKDVR